MLKDGNAKQSKTNEHDVSVGVLYTVILLLNPLDLRPPETVPCSVIKHTMLDISSLCTVAMSILRIVLY